MTTTDPIPPEVAERIARMVDEQRTGYVKINFTQGRFAGCELAEFSRAVKPEKRRGLHNAT